MSSSRKKKTTQTADCVSPADGAANPRIWETEAERSARVGSPYTLSSYTVDIERGMAQFEMHMHSVGRALVRGGDADLAKVISHYSRAMAIAIGSRVLIEACKKPNGGVAVGMIDDFVTQALMRGKLDD